MSKDCHIRAALLAVAIAIFGLLFSACSEEPASKTPHIVVLGGTTDGGGASDGTAKPVAVDGGHSDADVASGRAGADSLALDAGGISGPTMAHRTGTHHITEFWPQQAILDQVGAGAIRINIGGKHLEAHSADPAKFDWPQLDGVIAANAGKTILATVYVRHSALDSKATPKIPETDADVAAFRAWTDALAARYGHLVRYWQLENEVTMASHWPADKLAQYAKLLAVLHDSVAAKAPTARVVVAGFRSVNSPQPPKAVADVLDAIAAHAPAAIDAIDIHHHTSASEGIDLAKRIVSYRALLTKRFAHGSKVEVVVTENSTWMDTPKGLPTQSTYQQARFAVHSIYAALGAGASWAIFGTLMDRPTWQGKPALHKFNLNGLFYNPDKGYSDGKHQGPKPVAFVLWAIGHLLDAIQPVTVEAIETGIADLVRYEADGAMAHTVLWWSGNGSPTIGVDAPKDAKQVRVWSLTPNKNAKWPPTDMDSTFAHVDIPVSNDEVKLDLQPMVPVIMRRVAP